VLSYKKKTLIAVIVGLFAPFSFSIKAVRAVRMLSKTCMYV